MKLKLKNRKFTHEGRRAFPFHLAGVAAEAMGSYGHSKFGLFLNLWVSSQNGIAEFWYEVDQYRNTYQLLLQRYLKQPQLLKLLEQKVRRSVKYFENQLSQQPRHNLGLNKRELTEFLELYHQVWLVIFSSISVVRRLDTSGLEKLHQFLYSQLKPEQVGQAVTVLCATDRLSYLAREEIGFLSGLSKVLKKAAISQKRKKSVSALNHWLKQNSQINRFLQYHCLAYGWVAVGYNNEPARTPVYYFKRTAILIKEDADLKKLLKEKSGQAKAVRAERRKLFKKLRLNQEQKILCQILQDAAYTKDVFREMTARIVYAAKPFFKEIAKHSNLHENDLRQLSLKEMEKLLMNKVRVSRSLIKKRREVYVGRWTGKGLAVNYEREAQSIVRQYFSGSAGPDLNVFVGRSASPGRAVGRARIIHQFKDLRNFKKGEILVVNNTTPDFVPAMHAAKAIIAEEGGITAHVAVVSRELGVPCVVGVEYVTKILNDGDMVEVDANKGIVKKL